MLRWAALICGALIATPAFAADDPAITVCEAVLKSRLRAPKSYERVSADISENQVVLTYDAVNVYNAPLRNDFLCTFEKDKDGKAALVSSRMPDLNRELDQINADIAKAKAAGVTPEARAEIQSRLKALQKELVDEIIISIGDISVASKLPLYPLDLSKSRLDFTK